MRHGFTLIEAMLVATILAVIAAIALPRVVEGSAMPTPTTEQDIDLGAGERARIVILPTGERVLLTYGGVHACLLPPAPVEKP